MGLPRIPHPVEATEWALERFPPPLASFLTVPPADPLAWQLHAATAATDVGVLFVEATADAKTSQSLLGGLRRLLSDSPQAVEVFDSCKSTIDRYIDSRMASGATNSDFGFALGKWMWYGIYGRKPTSDESADMYELGRLVHASFGNYWGEGVRNVAVGECP